MSISFPASRRLMQVWEVTTDLILMPLLCKRVRDSGQNAGSGAHSGTVNLQDGNVRVVGHALDQTLRLRTPGCNQAPGRIRVHGVLDGNREFYLSQRLNGAGMKNLRSEIGEFSRLVIGKEGNELRLGNELRIRTHVAGHIFPDFQESRTHGGRHRSRGVVASSPSKGGDVSFFTDSKKSGHKDNHAFPE